ncbi:MAG: holo-ACP synthase [Planctomycetota bacterium]
MIRGVGTDLCEVARARALFKRWGPRLRGRVFSAEEFDAAGGRAESLAARWAAKEAYSKAMGTGFRGFLVSEVSVHTAEGGRPTLKLAGAALRRFQEAGGGTLHLSLTHEAGMALAVVVWEGV